MQKKLVTLFNRWASLKVKWAWQASKKSVDIDLQTKTQMMVCQARCGERLFGRRKSSGTL